MAVQIGNETVLQLRLTGRSEAVQVMHIEQVTRGLLSDVIGVKGIKTWLKAVEEQMM